MASRAVSVLIAEPAAGRTRRPEPMRHRRESATQKLPFGRFLVNGLPRLFTSTTGRSAFPSLRAASRIFNARPAGGTRCSRAFFIQMKAIAIVRASGVSNVSNATMAGSAWFRCVQATFGCRSRGPGAMTIATLALSNGVGFQFCNLHVPLAPSNVCDAPGPKDIWWRAEACRPAGAPGNGSGSRASASVQGRRE